MFGASQIDVARSCQTSMSIGFFDRCLLPTASSTYPKAGTLPVYPCLARLCFKSSRISTSVTLSRAVTILGKYSVLIKRTF